MSGWKRTKLRGKIHVKHGWPFKSECFLEQGNYVVLTPGNFFEQGGFKRNAEKDKCYSSPFPPEYLLRKGALIVAMTEQSEGLLGSTALIPSDNKFLHNQRLGLITATSDEVELEFIYHLFKSKTVREQIRLSSTGSKVKHTSPDRIYDVEVALPPVTIQKCIASVLSALDAKIELNNQINAELEGMAKLLYDYWFVQYDFPMSAAQAASLGRPALAGHPYRSSGGKLVPNETLNRPIPEGWSDAALQDIAKITMGQSPPGESYNENGEGELFFQGSTDFGWRFPSPRQYTTAATRIAEKGDILLSVRAPVGTLNIAPFKCAIGRGLSALHSKDGHDAFLFFVMQYFKQIFDRRNGDGTTFGSINKDDLRTLKLALPPKDLVQKYEDLAAKNNQLIFRDL